MESISKSVPYFDLYPHVFDAYLQENINWRQILELQYQELLSMLEFLNRSTIATPDIGQLNNMSGQIRKCMDSLGLLEQKIINQNEQYFNSDWQHVQEIFKMDLRILQESLRDDLLQFEKDYLQLKQKFRSLSNPPL